MALGDRISRIVRSNCNDLTGKLEPVEGAGFIATGAATGAGVSATVGGMGLVGGFGGIGIGMAPVAAAGAIAGAAAYGAKKRSRIKMLRLWVLLLLERLVVLGFLLPSVEWD